MSSTTYSPYSSCVAVQLACLPRYILRELFLCFSFYEFLRQVEWHQYQLAYRWMTWSAECGRVECLQPILLPVFRGAPLWLSHDKGVGPFKLLTLCVLQKRWDNSPLKACFEKSTSIYFLVLLTLCVLQKRLDNFSPQSFFLYCINLYYAIWGGN